jgi:hypothetical protein
VHVFLDLEGSGIASSILLYHFTLSVKHQLILLVKERMDGLSPIQLFDNNFCCLIIISRCLTIGCNTNFIILLHLTADNVPYLTPDDAICQWVSLQSNGLNCFCKSLELLFKITVSLQNT